jgi:hypothetical protein
MGIHRALTLHWATSFQVTFTGQTGTSWYSFQFETDSSGMNKTSPSLSDLNDIKNEYVTTEPSKEASRQVNQKVIGRTRVYATHP